MIADVAAGIFSGLLGAMGFGGGGILILYLTLYKNMPQLAAQGVNLIFFIPSAILALIFHTKNRIVEWKTALRYILTSLPGLVIGYFIVTNINEAYIRKFFAIILIMMGVKDLIFKSKGTR